MNPMPFRYLKTAILIVAVYVLCIASLACSQPVGEFFFGSLGLGETRILVATSNPAAFTILLYDLDGNLIDVVKDYTASNDNPKGIAPFDAFSFAVLLDGADRIALASLVGKDLPIVTADTNLTGTLYQMALDPTNDRYYAIEGNTIEAFDRLSGARISNPYIGTTIGTCVLNTPRGIFATEDNRLIVVGTGNDRLNIYDVSTTPSACDSFNNSMGATDPIAVIQHSNGLIYLTTQGDDRVYSLPQDGSGSVTTVWATDTTIISNPTALLELPDGSILVASDATNSIERISASGERVGSTSFIRDAFTGLVSQMMLIGGE